MVVPKYIVSKPLFPFDIVAILLIIYIPKSELEVFSIFTDSKTASMGTGIFPELPSIFLRLVVKIAPES